MLLLLVIFFRRKSQKHTRDDQQEEERPPFLQQKPELDGGVTRHEMPAVDRRFELHAEDSMYEIMTAESTGQRQELRGEEPARELDG